MKQNNALVQLFLPGMIIGLTYYAISASFDKLSQLMCESGSAEIFTLNSCSGSSVLGYVVPILITGIIGILILRKLKVAYVLPIVFFAGITTIASLFLANVYESLTAGIALATITAGLSYVIFGLIFNHGPKLFSTRLTIAAIVAGVAIFAFPTLSSQVSNTRYEEEREAKLASIDIDLYAPKSSTGKFVYERYSFNEFSDPPYITLDFTNGLNANVFKRPSYFNPPINCGQTRPYGDGSVKFECEFAATTPRGRKVYSYTQAATLKYNPNAKPESYFVDLGSTVISLEYFPREITLDEIIMVVDALEPVSLDELKNLNISAEQSSKSIKSNAEQHVQFKVFKPTYSPDGYRLKRYLLGNPYDPTNPDLLVEFTNNLRMYEFKSKQVFNPPQNCGQSSAESEGKYSYAVGCSLFTTTPKGTKIYSNNVEYFLMLNGTKITIMFGPNDKNEITRLVDSLVETPLAQLNYEKYQ